MSNHQQTPPPPPPGANLPQGQPYGEGPAPEPTKRSWFARHKVLTGILGVLALFIVIGALGGGDDESPSVAAQTSAGSTDPAEEGTGSSAGSPGSTAGEPAAEAETSAEDEATEDEEPAAEETEEGAVPADEESADATVGDVVTVGDFEVTVAGVEDGLDRIGDDMFGEEAQGQFVKILVTVQNTGDSAEYFLDSEQKLVDDQDRQHSTSSSSWLLDEESLFLAEINPGNKVEGVLLYDIPQDAVPTTLELQAGWFDGTVRVSLDG